MDVAMVNWPEEEPRRLELRSQGRARLLLVREQAPAPIASDPLEDWIRVPADENDMRARVDALRLRSGLHEPVRPTLDSDGLLRKGDLWVGLPLIEARLIGALLAKSGAVVSRDALIKAGWPNETPTRNVLDVHILRLRRRLGPIGLSIRTVRSRGYVLEE
jgi:DNA-binding response OmpR family regulator